jgi:DNA-binding NarL/FixJ family response regulator
VNSAWNRAQGAAREFVVAWRNQHPENHRVGDISQNESKVTARRRIVLVDDHPLVRERLSEIINRERDLVVCAEAEDRAAAIDTIQKTHPHLAIVDLTLKRSDGLELIKDIKARWPKLPVLVLSMHDESLYAERVIRAGALGYITKQEATRSILVAIRQVLRHEVYLSTTTATQLVGKLTTASDPRQASATETLTDRELQVFELTGRGLNTRQIAAKLSVGVKTVETYRLRIREKLQVTDPAELLPLAIAWVHRAP